MPTTKKRIIIYIVIGLIAAAVIIAAIAAGTGTPGTQSAAELLSLGQRYLLDMNYEQALVMFTRVIEIDPRNERGYTGAAQAYMGLGQTDNAIAVLEQGLAMIPESGAIRHMLEALRSGVPWDADIVAQSTPPAQQTPPPANLGADWLPDEIFEILLPFAGELIALQAPDELARDAQIEDLLQRFWDAVMFINEENLLIEHIQANGRVPTAHISENIMFSIHYVPHVGQRSLALHEQGGTRTLGAVFLPPQPYASSQFTAREAYLEFIVRPDFRLQHTIVNFTYDDGRSESRTDIEKSESFDAPIYQGPRDLDITRISYGEYGRREVFFQMRGGAIAAEYVDGVRIM